MSEVMYVAGIDLGSVAAKAIIMNGEGKCLSWCVTEAKPDIEKLADELINRALADAGLKREQLTYTVSTGYGRVAVSLAKETRTEIMCHALGVHHLFPEARIIIDVGGQDSKAIRIDEKGHVLQFAMNDRCAAGTGRFTEVMARALDIPLEHWGETVRSATRRARISNVCTVFAESEVISKIAEKMPIEQILAGVCEAIVNRIYQLVQKLGKLEPGVAFTGGVAKNSGVAIVLAEKLGVDLIIPESPQNTGALGACLLARNFAKQDCKDGATFTLRRPHEGNLDGST